MRVYLRWDKFTGVEPGTTDVYSNRDVGAAWEEVSLDRQQDGSYTATYVAANLQLSVQPDGRLETRPAGTSGAWERFTAMRGPGQPPTEGILSRAVDGVVVGRPLTIVSADGSALNLPGSGGGNAGDSSGGGQSGFLRVQPYTYQPNPHYGRPFTVADLVDESGAPWPAVIYTMHLMPPFVAKGGDIDPLLDDVVSYGYNTILVIGCHLSDWKNANGWHYDPRDPQHPGVMAHIFERAAAKGLRVVYQALADVQGVSQSDQTRIWQQAADISRGRWNVILGLGNEAGANGWDPSRFDKPGDMGGVLVSRGSYGLDTVPYPNQWDITMYESRRDWIKSAVDATTIELAFGGWDQNPHGFTNVLWNVENVYFHDTFVDGVGDQRENDPRLALLMGRLIGAGCNGGGFGASDGLECRSLGPTAAECARQFARGLRGAFVR